MARAKGAKEAQLGPAAEMQPGPDDVDAPVRIDDRWHVRLRRPVRPPETLTFRRPTGRDLALFMGLAGDGTRLFRLAKELSMDGLQRPDFEQLDAEDMLAVCREIEARLTV